VTYCDAKCYSLIKQTVASERIGKQDIWIEAVIVDGKFRAEGTGSNKKKAHASAAAALIRSGILPGFAEFE
jgi:dsRNA-specific ribonuclease